MKTTTKRTYKFKFGKEDIDMTKDDLFFDFKLDCASVSIVLPVPVNRGGYPSVDAFAYYVTNNERTDNNIRCCAKKYREIAWTLLKTLAYNDKIVYSVIPEDLGCEKENEDHIKCWCSTSGHICVIAPKETTEKVVLELAEEKMGKSNIKCLGLEPCPGQTPRELIKDYELERGARRGFNLSIVQEKDKGRRTIYL